MGDLRLLNEPEKVIVFKRNELLFAFNFNTSQSFTNVLVPVNDKADYKLVLSSDDEAYGGQGLSAHMIYPVKEFNGQFFVELYLPARTAAILEMVKPSSNLNNKK